MKKIMLFIIALIPICLLFTVQVSTNFVKSSNYISVDRVVFSKEKETINKTTDEPLVYEFPAKVVPISATEQEIIYSSSDENVATVDEKGVITFYCFGRVIITATSKADSNIKTSCSFFITDTNPHEIKILNKRESLNIGQSYYLDTIITPDEAVDKNITFKSTNTSVATVSLDGKVTAVGSGKTTISARTVNGKVDKFELEVVIPLKNISINEDNKTLVTGKTTAQFPKISFTPADATNKEVTYSSADESIATITDSGEITFLKAGTITFTATSVEGEYKTEYTVTSTNGYVISADIISSKNIEIDYIENKELDFRFNYYPLDIDLNNIKVVSSNNKVVKVEDNKIIIVGGGNATVTLRANNGSMWLESKVNIKVNRRVESIIASDMEISNYDAKIDYAVLPSDNTEKVSFKTSSSLAKVNSNGYITFVNPGSVVVTISSSSGVTKEITVTYKPNETDYILKEINSETETLTLNYMERFAFSYNIPIDIDNLEIDYNQSMLSLDENIFTAIKGGVSEVKIFDGSVETVINVTTIRKAEDLILYDENKDVTDKTISTIRSEIKLTTLVLQEDTTNKEVTFTSSNNEIAVVENGVVKFAKAGKIIITASVDNVAQTVEIESTFGRTQNFDVSAQGMTSSSGVNTLTFKDVNLTSKIELSNYNNPSDYVFDISHFEFKSTNSNVVSVDGNGNLISKGRGNATITIISGKVSKTINVVVEVLTKSVDITYSNGYETIVLDYNKIIGNQIVLGSQVYPENANNKNVEFIIMPEGEDIAKIVDQNKLVFSGFGEVTVRVMTLDSNGSIYKDVHIERIEEIDNLKIYAQSQDVTGKTITKESSDNVNIVLEVVPTIPNVLDSENINYEMLSISKDNILDEEGLTTTITRQGNGIFVISKSVASGVNKRLSTKLTFTFGSKNSASVNIVYKNLQDLNFYYYELNGVKYDLVNEEDNSEKYGLERKRVFGTHEVRSGEMSPDWNIKFYRVPENNTDPLYWFSSDENFAVVDSNGVITFKNPNFTGEKQVEIIVSESSNKNDLSVIRASYVFTFVYGANIWTNEDYLVACSKFPMVLHTNLGVAGEDDVDKTIPFDVFTSQNINNNMIYGNGRTINLHNYKPERNHISYYSVRNATLRGANTNQEKNFIIDMVVGDNGAYYTIFENFRKVWTGTTTTILYSHCVFRYNALCGLQMGGETTGKVYIEDCIFFDTGKSAIDYQAGELYIKGRFDVYNFREPAEIATGALSVAQYAIKDAFKSYTDYVVTWETGSVIKTKHYAANIAIAAIYNNGVPHDVYFYSHNDGTKDVYLKNEDKRTGLNYTMLTSVFDLGVVKYDINLFIPPINDKIVYGQTPTKEDIEQLARKVD